MKGDPRTGGACPNEYFALKCHPKVIRGTSRNVIPKTTLKIENLVPHRFGLFICLVYGAAFFEKKYSPRYNILNKCLAIQTYPMPNLRLLNSLFPLASRMLRIKIDVYFLGDPIAQIEFLSQLTYSG